MKLRRKIPTLCIWLLFTLVNALMVGRSGFSLGLFPASNRLGYTLMFSSLGIIWMNAVTLLAGKVCDNMKLYRFAPKKSFEIIYKVLIAGLVIAAFIYRYRLTSVGEVNFSGNPLVDNARKILFFAVAADMAFYIGYAILGRGFMSVAQNRYYKMFPDAGKRKVVKDYARMKEEMNSLEGVTGYEVCGDE